MTVITRGAVALSVMIMCSSVPLPVQAKKTHKAQPASVQDHLQVVTDLGIDGHTLQLINQGKWKDAQARLAELSDKETGATRTKAWLAFAYMYRVQCDVFKALTDSIKDKPKDDVNVTLIETFDLLCQRKFVDGEKRLQTLPAAAMSDPFVNFAFAAVSAKQGRAAVATTYVQRATDLAPDFGWGFKTRAAIEQQLLHDNAAAEADYAKALEIEPICLEAINPLVDLKLIRNDFDGAIDVAQAAIKSDPQNAFNHYRVAQIYLQQWRLREARGELESAVRLSPNDAKSYRAIASILRYQGKLDEAIEKQKKAADLGTDKVFDLLELANMETAAGKDEAAIAALKEVLATNPNNQPAATQLERLLIKDGKFDELISTIKELLAKDSKSASLHERLGNALAAAGKPDAAVDEYKEAANLNQNDPVPHRKIGAIKITQKDYGSAAKEYTRALNINSTSVPDLVALGFCYGQTDDYLQAEAAFVTALALHQLTQAPDSTVPPTTPDIMRALATLLFEEGRYADAASQFTSVLSMTKSTANGPLDQFMTAQAIALRDRSNIACNNLVTAFQKLSPKEKEQQQINLVDTLIRANRFDAAGKYLGVFNPVIANQVGWQANKLAPPAEQTSTPAEKVSGTEKTSKDSREQTYVWISWARIFRGKNDLPRAEKAAHQAVDLSLANGSPHSDALCEMGELNLLRGRYEEAEKNASEAMQVNQKSYRACELLSRVALKSGKAKEAIGRANKALELNPYYTDSYLSLGAAQIATKDLSGALANFQKAVNLYPGNIQTHEALICVLKKLQKNADIKQEQAIIVQLKNQQ